MHDTILLKNNTPSMNIYISDFIMKVLKNKENEFIDWRTASYACFIDNQIFYE